MFSRLSLRRVPSFTGLAVLLAAMLGMGSAGLTSAAATCTAGHLADGNDCDWVGRPSFISGTSVYDRGEYIYSDYVHDDYGANVDGFKSGELDNPQPITGIYPNFQDPSHPRFGASANNGRFRHTGDYGYPSASPADSGSYYDVADILEFRIALDRGQLHFLTRLGALQHADDTVIGVGIDSDLNAKTGAWQWPLGANVTQPLGYEYFITFWGTGGQLTDYTVTPARTIPIHSAANVAGRFLEADSPLPASATLGTWRFSVGSGRWDSANHSWATVTPTTTQDTSPGSLGQYPNVYNLLFRPYEPNNWWRDTTQANDLAQQNIAEDHADINMTALKNGYSGPRPAPTGLLNIQYNTLPLGDGQGVEANGSPFGQVNYIYRGPVEPYTLMLPSAYYSKPHPRPFVFFYHCLNCNHNIWPFGVEDAATQADGSRDLLSQSHIVGSSFGTSHIQAIVNSADLMVGGSVQRGEGGAGHYGWGYEERDLRDVYNTILHRDGYSVDPNRVFYSGMSMGGATTDHMMTLYPDEIAAAIAHSSTFAMPARLQNIRNVYYMQITGDTGLDSTASSSGRLTAQNLDQLGYQHMYLEYLGRAHDFTLVYDSLPMVRTLGWSRVRDINPAQVSYQLDAASEYPALGLTHDHAYWVSGLKLSDKAPSGTVDAIALPLSYKLPKSASLLRGTFTDPVRGWNAYVDWLAYNQDLGGHGLQDFEKTWQPDPDVTVTPVKVTQPPGAGSNGFTATLTSLSAETLDLDRMSESLSQNVVGDVKTSTATTATFVSRYLTGVREVIVDGTPQFVAARNGQLSVSLTPGRHTVVIVVSGGAKAVTAAPPATRARASWASPRHAVAVQLDRFVSSLTAPLIAVGLIVLLTAAGGAVLAARARPRT